MNNPPPITQPFFDANGKISNVWLRWFNSISSTEGGDTEAIVALAARIAVVESQLSEYRTIASGEDIDRGTDNSRTVTAKALEDSTYVPHVSPSDVGAVLQSDGTKWISSIIEEAVLIHLLNPVGIQSTKQFDKSNDIATLFHMIVGD
jgi:hypothetical protein